MRVFRRLHTQKSHIIRMETNVESQVTLHDWECHASVIMSSRFDWRIVHCELTKLVYFYYDLSLTYSIQPLRQQSSVTQELIEINSPHHVMLKKPRSENVRHVQTNPPVMKFHCWQSWHGPPTSRFSPQLAKNPAKQRLVRLVLFRVSSRSGLKKM